MIKKNFIRLFEDSFRKNWYLPAFSNYGENLTLTYKEAAIEVARLHILFEQCGIKPNDKIALIGKNNANWAITYIASVTYGAVIVPILQDFTPHDVHHIANHSESKLLFVSDFIWENLEEENLHTIHAVFSLSDFSPIALINQTREIDSETKKEPHSSQVWNIIEDIVSKKNIDLLFNQKYVHGFNKDDVRYINKPNNEIVSINYTSGTTGFSKGVMTSGNALAGNITFGFRTKLVAPEYNIVSFLPLAHAYGCAFDFLTPVCTGCHIHFIGRTPSPKILLKAFSDIKPNVIFLVPLIIEKIYKKQIQPLIEKPLVSWVLSVPFLDQAILTQVRKKLIESFGGNFSQIVAGGAPLNGEVEAFFHKIKFPFTVGYGMTECAPLISFSNYSEFIPKSAGKTLDIMEVKIDNPDPTTGIGEIFVKGENVMSGYFKNQEATNAIMDTEGWLHTGDLGIVDENGNVFIRGRNKTMILSASGQNIYPEEIESKLNNLPFVSESLILDDKGKLVALVFPDYDAMDVQNIDNNSLESIMANNLKSLNAMCANYEQVAKIQIYPKEFEKTPKKSIKRYLYSANFDKSKDVENS